MFDHREFADQMKKCDSLWLITYDDCYEIRKNFDFTNVYEWQLQYGMNNYKQGKSEKGNELFIMNYHRSVFQTVLFDKQKTAGFSKEDWSIKV
jgi:DNA adenine methylase